MSHGLTPSEIFVTRLCNRSFLKLWTHPNPIGKKGKELCDCLIVCGPHIVIISVKENEYKDTGDSTGLQRWNKAAVEKSVSQIWGAERWLESSTKITRHDDRIITLPPKTERRYHRISVSLGGRGKVSLEWGDFGNGFVHICDEYSVGVLLGELDTISDFVGFLTASETLVSNGVKPVFSGGGVEDLVGLFLSCNHSFELLPQSPETPDLLIIQEGIWKEYRESDLYKEISQDLRESYIWDRLIEHYTADLLSDGMFDMHSKEVTQNELALVTMALQPRGHRANLAESFIDFLRNQKLKVASRVVLGDNNTAFVFLVGKSSDREVRSKELFLRCLVIRGRIPNITTVIGIATDKSGTSDIGYSSDIAYLHLPEWSDENEKKVKSIQADLGYFQNTKWKTD